MNLSQSSAILLSQRAALTPDREALLLTDSGDRFSYGELDARSVARTHGAPRTASRPRSAASGA